MKSVKPYTILSFNMQTDLCSLDIRDNKQEAIEKSAVPLNSSIECMDPVTGNNWTIEYSLINIGTPYYNLKITSAESEEILLQLSYHSNLLNDSNIVSDTINLRASK